MSAGLIKFLERLKVVNTFLSSQAAKTSSQTSYCEVLITDETEPYVILNEPESMLLRPFN